jgi:predicted nuclease with TOPRIM domain
MRRLKRNLNTSGRKNRALQNKLNEYRSAVETLREQLTDLNLFNSKLLYVNKLLQNKNVSATQRKSIIESLDSARSLREVKLLYKSLIESFSKDKPKNLSESAVRRTLGSSSRATRRASAQTSEAAEVNRWAELAGLK